MMMMMTTKGAKPAGLSDMPADVVREILARTDQAGRVGCMLACKSMLDTARHPCVFREVHMSNPDSRGDALRFFGHVTPRALTLTAASPDDAALFLDSAVSGKYAAACAALRSLTVNLGSVQRVPNALLAAALRLPGLRALHIRATRVARGCDLTFPKRVLAAGLRELRIEELGDGDEGRNLVVLFNGAQARMPELESVTVIAQSSDVLACGADALPSLRAAVYRSDEDSYGDLDLIDMDLDRLELDVHAESHLDALFGQLAGMARAGSLRLVAWDDVLIDSPLPCVELAVEVCHAEGVVQLDLVSLGEDSPDLRSVRVAPPDGQTHAVMLRVVSVPRFSDFMDFCRRVTLDVAPCTRMHLEPL